MITRIVKLTFREEEVNNFLTLFDESQSSIRSFPGQIKLSLYKDRTHNNVYFTISLWESEEALNEYRNSALFASVWSRTKSLFASKAEAWSLDELQN